MRAVNACAPRHEEVDWNAVDWRSVYRNVRRLQARIVQATQEGRWGKVQALQRLLTHSYSGRCLAVRRVTENRGKKTAGVDGITWDTPAQKGQAVAELRPRGYRPQPLRRVYIPKSSVENLEMLHPVCHRQLHSREIPEGKPCPNRGI